MSKGKNLQEGKAPYVVEFSKPYLFEGEEYTCVDLSGLDGLSTKNLLEAERSWTIKGNASMQLESNIAYCLEVAAIATGKPFEFFEGLSFKDGIAVKNKVVRDFFGLTE